MYIALPKDRSLLSPTPLTQPPIYALTCQAVNVCESTATAAWVSAQPTPVARHWPFAARPAHHPAPSLTWTTRSLSAATPPTTRSEEHTSELQSPYVISYAVF